MAGRKVQTSGYDPFIILGVLAGMRNVYLLVRHANEDLEEKKEEGKDEER